LERRFLALCSKLTSSSRLFWAAAAGSGLIETEAL
jgi:hypothetical protein